MNPVPDEQSSQQRPDAAYVREMPRRLPPSTYLEPGESTAARRTRVNVFGTPRARSWRVPDGGTEQSLRAAQLQHAIAVQLRDAITVSEYGNQAEFARRRPEFTYDRLRGVLSGDIWMRLEDITEISHLLGVQPLVNLEESNQDALG